MDIIQEVGADQEHIGKLVEGMMAKLVPKQLHNGCHGYTSAISKMAEFIALTGFPYNHDEIKHEFDIMIPNFTRLVMEAREHEMAGYHDPISHSLEVPRWGSIANQLSLPFQFDERLMPIFDFEFYHYDYKGDSQFTSPLDDFPTLDLIRAAQLYGFADSLKEKQRDNPYDARCHERAARKATEADIHRYCKDESEKRLAFAIMKSDKDGIDMSFQAEDGTILYLRNAPEPPRQIHTFADIQHNLNGRLVQIVKACCDKGEDAERSYRLYEQATNMLYRRNLVKGFLGSDVAIPEQLVEHHRTFWSAFDLEQVRRNAIRSVSEYTPHSLSYALSIPENMTRAEYCFFRYMGAFVSLSRRGTLLFDTDEKKEQLGLDVGKLPIEVIKMGYQEALRFEKCDRSR
ncbi:MAG: hypothetical protein KJ561_01045 [Nanoarchaeota archaeon]|nr:hypothetical protein [Nanoarchaeota archaeon]